MNKTFSDILAEKMGNAYLANERTERIQDELTQVKNLQDSIDREVTRLNRIKWLAEFKTDPMSWQKQTNDIEDRPSSTKWRYWHTLELSTLHFQVVVRERTDRKRNKFEVKVRASERTLSTRHGDVQGGYVYTLSMDDYVVEPEYCFINLEEAETLAARWRYEIEKRYADVIKEERELAKLAKASEVGARNGN